jgi:hypothetical protein
MKEVKAYRIFIYITIFLVFCFQWKMIENNNNYISRLKNLLEHEHKKCDKLIEKHSLSINWAQQEEIDWLNGRIKNLEKINDEKDISIRNLEREIEINSIVGIGIHQL